MKHMISRYRGFAGLVSSNLLNNIVTFLTVIVLSKLITPEEFGVFTLCVSIMMTCASILDFGTNLSFVRWYNLKGESVDRESLFGAAILIQLCTTTGLLFFLFPLSLLLKIYLMKQVGTSSDIFYAMLAAGVFNWWTLIRAIRQAQQNHQRYSFVTVLFSIIRMAVLPCCYLLDMVSPTSILVGLYLVAPLAIVLFEGFTELTKIKHIRPLSHESRSMAKRFIVYGKWSFASSVLFPIVSSVPVWVLAHLNYYSAVGAYGVGLSFANAMAPLRDAIRVYMFPKIVGFSSKQMAIDMLAKLKGKFIYIPLIALSASLLTVFAQKLIHGHRYEHVHIVIILMISTQVITMYTNIIGNLLHYLGKPYVHPITNIFCVTLSLALSALLVPDYGVVGAAMAASLSILSGEYIIYRYLSRQLFITESSCF
ncbi:MAG: oligosaccharide flippase family protein [Chlorobium sp.]|nr:oligosaccharide flippase family protein [Chlorobium sp.]